MTIFNTRGIVLRTVKYGETSIITTIFTEVFGLKTYLVQGARSGKKTGRAHFFQPASLLEMQVYNNEMKNLQRIKETRWSYLYKEIYADVIKNTVALYLIELLLKSLKEPEANFDMFSFCESALIRLDSASDAVTANYPLYFSLHLPAFMGFQITNNFSEINCIFDIREGSFTKDEAFAAEYASKAESRVLHKFLSAGAQKDIEEIKLNGKIRKDLLDVVHAFYCWHLPEMGVMKTPAILSEIL